MKNAYKSFALLCMGLAAVACVGEQFEDDKPNKTPIAENEIIFSASASVETGNKQTKTAYGDVVASDKEDGTGKTGTVQINWKHNDPIMIASPHTAGTTHAKYLVNLGENATENTVASTAVSLDRQGDVGLQWSGRNEPYQFWAMYPSPDTFADVENPVSVDVENESIVMKGHLPVDKRYTTIPAAVNGRYEFAPDMMYAYMVANDTYQYGSEDDAISLKFTSLVTAMQFELQTGTITADQANSEIIVSQIVLFSAGNQKLTGDFTYKFDGVENCSEGTSAYASVTFDNVNQNNKPNGLILTEGNVCDVTFFMLPSYDYMPGDLQLKVVYYYDGALQTKTATIGSKIIPTKKYHFKGVQLPNITKVDASSWFDVLDPETPVALLSIPVAGNTFSYSYSGDDAAYFKQQVVIGNSTTSSLKRLWDYGVRGFEFRTSFEMNNKRDEGNVATNSTGIDSGTYTVEDEEFICGGNFLGTNLTFSMAFEELYEILQKNKSETAVVIATYQSKGGDFSGGYSPLGYIRALETYLTSFCTAKSITDKSEVFAKLTTGSKVKDIQGRIVIVVRPSDDDYVRYDRNNNSNTKAINYSIYDIKPSDTWDDYISVIPNWGTAVDQFDKRYGEQYLSEGQFAYNNSQDFSDDDDASSMIKFESSYLKQTRNTSSTRPGWINNSFPAAKPYWEASVNYNTSEKAYIQSWERISPIGQMWYAGSRWAVLRPYYHYYPWPNTLAEKKTAIMELLNAARNSEINNKVGLYINNLSGYFITENRKQSVFPYIGSENSFDLDGAGQGGDYASCAAELNYYLWNELNTSKEYGPLGLIIFDYIGAEASDFQSISNTTGGVTPELASNACKVLPGLILMNNFKVKPSTGGSTGGSTDGGNPGLTSYDAVYENGGEAISFE